MTTNAADSKVTTLNPHFNLLESCKKGDQRAQFQIYKLYYKSMYNTSLRIVNDPAEAEDIMQESFLTAFEEITSFSGEVSFGAWLKRIVINRSIDMLRKKSRIKFEDIELVSEGKLLYEEEQINGEPERFKLNRIMEAIGRLSESCRKIFNLYFLEGYDHEEISEILSISPSTSRSQLSRARNRIIADITHK